MEHTPKQFEIVDLKERVIVGSAKSRRRAESSAERRNQEYGAHRYTVHNVSIFGSFNSSSLKSAGVSL